MIDPFSRCATPSRTCERASDASDVAPDDAESGAAQQRVPPFSLSLTVFFELIRAILSQHLVEEENLFENE